VERAAVINGNSTLLLDLLAIVIRCGKDNISELLIGQINGAAYAEASPSKMTMPPPARTSRLWTDLSSPLKWRQPGHLQRQQASGGSNSRPETQTRRRCVIRR